MFTERLAQKVIHQSPLLLGLDPVFEKLPPMLKSASPEPLKAIQNFCQQLLEVSAPQVAGIKIQLAYFERWGSGGIAVVEQLIQQAKAQDLFVLIDGKRGDIGSTAQAYASAYLDPESPLAGDALTVNPLLGPESLEPFLFSAEKYDRGLFILLQTSNDGAAAWQRDLSEQLGTYLAEKNQALPPKGWSRYGVVVGATQTSALQNFRGKLPQQWFLTPGVGAQGGSLENCLAIRREGLGVLIPVSRSVLYASSGADYLSAAQQELERLNDEIKAFSS